MGKEGWWHLTGSSCCIWWPPLSIRIFLGGPLVSQNRRFDWMAIRRVQTWGCKGGAVVRALATHQCGPGSTPGVDTICGLSLLLVLSFAPRGFSPGTPVFPSPQKPTLANSNSIWNARTRLNQFMWTPMCFVGKQAMLFFYCLYSWRCKGVFLTTRTARKTFTPNIFRMSPPPLEIWTVPLELIIITRRLLIIRQKFPSSCTVFFLGLVGHNASETNGWETPQKLTRTTWYETLTPREINEA